MAKTIVVEDYEEFIARHGVGPGMPLLKTSPSEWLLPSGAVITNDGHGPQRHEPPEAPAARLELQRRYFREAAARAETAFIELQDAILGKRLRYRWDESALGPPAPEKDEYGQPSGKAALLLLRDLTGQRYARAESIERQIANLPENRERRKRQREERELRERMRARDESLKHEIRQITLSRKGPSCK